jgi:hypothetical protein
MSGWARIVTWYVGADIDFGRFEVTSHFELADRGAFVIGYIRAGFIRPGMCVDTHLEPPRLRITGVEVLDNSSEKKHWNALIFAERPTLDFVKAAFPIGGVIEVRAVRNPMRKMTQDEWDRVADAIVVWTGKGELAWPQLDEARVLARFGPGVQELLPVLRELYDDFYLSDARWRAADLAEMAEMARARFRDRYPLLRPSAVDALAWCYTFDYK